MLQMRFPFENLLRSRGDKSNRRFASVQYLEGFTAANLALDFSPVGLHLSDGNGFHVNSAIIGVRKLSNFRCSNWVLGRLRRIGRLEDLRKIS